MAIHNDTGAEGEKMAAIFLENAGYTILERNFRWKRFEIDIICQKEKFLVFVEVKTKTNVKFGMPEMEVTAKKAAQVTEAAMEYVYEKHYKGEIRFDIIAVVIKDNSFKIEHFIDAFY